MNAINHDIFRPTIHYGTNELLVLWAFGHLTELEPDFKRPNKKIDTAYKGRYDLYLDRTDIKNKQQHIKIGVKALRAIDIERNNKLLYVKALASNSKKRFDMNFQQVKPACCDVFIWIGVWRDAIRYWVLASREMESNKYYSTGQHRGNTGEGQLHLKDDNIAEFSKYEVKSDQLAKAIRTAYKRQKKK